jgi:ATPase subunit of ABC transporter with duplicated ATPase domains
VLRAVSLSKHLDLDPLFESVDLTLSPGDRVGLVGPSGVGKSTLMRVLAGVDDPTFGTVVRSPGLTVGWQAQEAPDPRQPVAHFVRSGAAALVAALDAVRRLEDGLGDATTAQLREYAAVLDQFEARGGWAGIAGLDQVRSRLGVHTSDGIDGSRPMGSLSGGEQSRVMLARLLVTDPDVLLLDEPTNHLDREGRRWLGDHLAGFRGAVLVISHDRRFLDRTVNRVVELDGIETRLQDYPGCGYSAYRLERERRHLRLLLDFEAQEKYRQRLRSDIERTKEHARGVELANPRNPSARRLARKVARKALSRERRLERQMRSAAWIADPQTRPQLTVTIPAPTGAPEQTDVLADLPAMDVVVGGRTLVRTPRLCLRRADRVLVEGRNGAGKTSLLRQIAPALPDGSVVLPQTHEQLPREVTALDFFRSRVPMYVDEAEQVLEGFLFDSVDRQRPLGRLSAGQVRRLLIAAMVNRPSPLLVLDEPTNHLDFDSLDVVERALSGYPGALLVVTHDEELAQRIGLTQRWVLADGRLESAA